MAGPDHAEVSHLHQQLGPEVRNVVFAVVDVVLERQQVRLLTLLDLVHAEQARAVCGGQGGTGGLWVSEWVMVGREEGGWG